MEFLEYLRYLILFLAALSVAGIGVWFWIKYRNTWHSYEGIVMTCLGIVLFISLF